MHLLARLLAWSSHSLRRLDAEEREGGLALDQREQGESSSAERCARFAEYVVGGAEAGEALVEGESEGAEDVGAAAFGVLLR